LPAFGTLCQEQFWVICLLGGTSVSNKPVNIAR
jgi:hypothetical protein